MARRAQTSREKVIAALRKAYGMSPIEVAKATGLEHDNVRQLLRRMTRAGEIRHQHWSYYAPDKISHTDDWYVRRSISDVLKRLEEERNKLALIGPLTLEEAIDFMARTGGIEYARKQFQKVAANLDKLLAEAEEDYWSDQKDEDE